jgi:tetratricopeptide (TPR) repeat protein
VASIEAAAFERALRKGAESERALRWQEAADLYADLSRKTQGNPRHTFALLRYGNALMELRRWDDARAAIDDALREAKAAADGPIMSQALLAAGIYAVNREDFPRAETFLMDALERFHRSDERSVLRGRGWTFLALAGLYGKTGRLDLAFVTFTKAQDVLGASEDWAGVAAAWEAQAQLRRSLDDEDRWREDLAEAVIFYDRAEMPGKAGRLRALLGRKLV